MHETYIMDSLTCEGPTANHRNVNGLKMDWNCGLRIWIDIDPTSWSRICVNRKADPGSIPETSKEMVHIM